MSVYSIRNILLLISAGSLGACAVNAELKDTSRGFGEVSAITKRKTGKESVWIQNREQADAVGKRVHNLIHKRTINADTAVQVALLNHKGLQASYAEIGMAAADVWQEALPKNPTLPIEVAGIGVSRAIESLLITNISALITKKKRVSLAEAKVYRAQLQAISETLRISAEVREAWINSVSTWEQAGHVKNATRASEAGSELALQLGKTGAIPKAAQAREHANYASMSAQLAQARLMANGAKQKLIRTMGIWGKETNFFVPNKLPSVPRNAQTMRTPAAAALRNRIDLRIAQADLEILARSHGLVNATRFVSDLDFGGGFEVERGEDGGNEVSGRIDLDFVIPIFDTGKARLKKAEFAYMRGAYILAQKAAEVRSEAETAYGGYRGKHDIARHYVTQVLPIYQTIEEQSLLNNNGMITNTFELLADAQGKLAAELDTDRAKRDFWLSKARLQASIYGAGPGDEEEGEEVEIEVGGEEDE